MGQNAGSRCTHLQGGSWVAAKELLHASAGDPGAFRGALRPGHWQGLAG